MRYFYGALALALATINPASTSCQVPSPPAPKGQDNLVADLISSIEKKDIKLYSSIISDDIEVFEDGTLISSGKNSWVNRQKKIFNVDGVVFSIKNAYISNDRILTIEYFNSLSSWGRTPPPDCCWRYDAVSYKIKNGKIYRIYRVIGGKNDIVK